MMTTLDQVKASARALRTSLATLDVSVTHSQALELVAHQLGYRDWNTAIAALKPSTAGLGAVVPVIRVQDEQLAREFYFDYLGFTPEWEHRFEPGFPVYLRARRDDAILDLSEHHGDGVPGSVSWIPVLDIDTLLGDLRSRPHPKLRPGIDLSFPGGPTIVVTDPFGNTLRFCQPSE
ncbi:glyoxalase superfamily protein [Janibacter hoylei]|uniref:glyoxalase superfamily protein n=1 Tax=Janibacter hoylei TaxID=364298 RepID=UPI0022385B26|nr:glyoxalase superfamily protein [Janibacter hoylei]MCW4600222.1 glyoxalase superfamily protein [Janibacter hoylei]